MASGASAVRILPFEFKKDVKLVLIDFGENTTAHGIPRATRSRTYKGRVFWLCVCALCFIVFVFQAISVIRRYYRHETITQIELKFEEVAFPAVTVCNINPYKYSMVLNENSLQRMLTSFDRALASGTRRETVESLFATSRRIRRQSQRSDAATVGSYQPVYAVCNCSTDSFHCAPSYKQPAAGQKPQCVCFYEKATSSVGPCHLEKHWRLGWCKCTKDKHCDPAELHLGNDGEEKEMFSNIEPCVCTDVSRLCMATFDKKFEDLWTLQAAEGEQEEVTTADPYEESQAFENVTDPAAIAIQGKINLMFAIASMSLEEKRALSYRKDDLIRMCVFNRQQCDIDRDFGVHVDPMYGNCYTFNYDARFNHTNRAGPVFGLRLMLHLDLKEYMPLTQELGARVAIHQADSFPFPDVFGYNAPAGVTSSFGIRLKKVNRLPAPYGNCSNAPVTEEYIYQNYTYSTEGCYRTCRQIALINNCGCGEPRFPVPNGHRHCAADDPVARRCIENASIYSDVAGCKCPQPCEQAVYDTTYSAAVWPSGSSHPSMLNCSGTVEECTQYLRENGAAIEIYFEQLNCEYLKESEAYLSVNLVSDLGGLLGLWLGFSLITVVEFLVLFYDLLELCFTCRKKPPPPPKDAFAEYNGDIYGPVSVECTVQLKRDSVY